MKTTVGGDSGRIAARSVATGRGRVIHSPLVAPPRTVRIVRRFRLKKQFAIVALALALAILIGTVVGSGFFNAGDRVNSELYQSQQGEGESYGVRDVPGHPGAGY